MAVLDKHEFASAVWLKLKRHMEERIEALRRKNDRHVDERRTSQLRASIGELKYLTGLDAEKPGPPPEDELFKD